MTSSDTDHFRSLFQERSDRILAAVAAGKLYPKKWYLISTDWYPFPEAPPAEHSTFDFGSYTAKFVAPNTLELRTNWDLEGAFPAAIHAATKHAAKICRWALISSRYLLECNYATAHYDGIFSVNSGQLSLIAAERRRIKDAIEFYSGPLSGFRLRCEPGTHFLYCDTEVYDVVIWRHNVPCAFSCSPEEILKNLLKALEKA